MRAFSDALRYEPAELPDVHVTTMLRAEEALGYPAMSTIPTTGRARFEPATVRPQAALFSVYWGKNTAFIGFEDS